MAKKNIEHITEYKKYASKNPLIRLALSLFFKELKKSFPRLKKANVIDIGCGDGFALKFLRKNFNYDFTGFDISPDTIRFAKKLNPNVKFIQGDIHKMPFDNRSFDIVVNLQVLEHLENPEKAINEMKRVSKRYCVLSVPREPFFRLANVARLKYLKTFGNYPDHIWQWSKRDFETILKKKFRKVNIRTSTIWTIAVCEI